MIRRNLFKLGGLSTALWFLQGTTSRAGSARTNVVYHLSDADKVGFVLGNIANHLGATKDFQNVGIILVVHGPALQAFVARSMDDSIAERTFQLRDGGLGLEACGNTLKAGGLTVLDLAPGFKPIEQGGVVRLAELQAQGYAYIRP